jgi:pimeloyl-[acyl-carrier protein] methyl ester esterase
MSLYIHTQGNGPHLVFLHGWGLHSDVWEEIAEQLADHYTVTLVDLPGHGRSKLIDSEFQIEQIARQLAEVIPEPAVWIGWSLGGLIALQVAHQHPEQVKALMMVASSPQFVQSEDWPHAVDPAVFAKFAEELEEDYQATLNRFIAIQAMGSSDPKGEVRKLRERLFRHGEPHVDALRGGLRILQQSNLRKELSELNCPVKIILGRRDTLANARALKQLNEQHPQLETTVMPGAAHTPFVSHPEEFLQLLKEFLERHV